MSASQSPSPSPSPAASSAASSTPATSNGAAGATKQSRAQQVAHVLAAASEAFEQLSGLVMELHPDEGVRSSHTSGTRWTDVEVKRLYDAMSSFNTDLQKISEAVKTRTVAQVRAKLKKDGIPPNLLRLPQTPSTQATPGINTPPAATTTAASSPAQPLATPSLAQSLPASSPVQPLVVSTPASVSSTPSHVAVLPTVVGLSSTPGLPRVRQTVSTAATPQSGAPMKITFSGLSTPAGLSSSSHLMTGGPPLIALTSLASMSSPLAPVTTPSAIKRPNSSQPVATGAAVSTGIGLVNDSAEVVPKMPYPGTTADEGGVLPVASATLSVKPSSATLPVQNLLNPSRPAALQAPFTESANNTATSADTKDVSIVL